MTRYTIRFEPVICKQTFKGKCRNCGKRCQQTLVVEATVNPFNKNAQGFQKTYSEVRADVVEKFKRLKAIVDEKGPQCASCQDDPEVRKQERVAARVHPIPQGDTDAPT